MAKVKRLNMKVVRRPNGDVLVLQRPAFVAAKKREVAAAFAARVKREGRSSGSLPQAGTD